MRPESLLGILFDFLDEYDNAGPLPADVVLSKFFKRRRYLGSHDRRFLADTVFSWFRYRIRGDTRWRLWAARAGVGASSDRRIGRLGVLLALAADDFLPWSVAELASAARSAAAAAGGGWVDALDRAVGTGAGAVAGSDGSRDADDAAFLSDSDWPDDPLDRLAAELSLPRWIVGRLVACNGIADVRALGEALLKPAPVDLRVSVSRIEREVVRVELERIAKGAVDTTPISPAGLRLNRRIDLKRFFKEHPGWIEVQDEGSQLAAMAVGVVPGDTVIDACAGGGGKMLALADLAGGEAKFHCCEIDVTKLEELLRRAEPLGLKSVTVHSISPSGPLPHTLPRNADIVVVDAPCSGSGSLRRNPDLKERYGEEEAAEFAATQRSVLERFAVRVRPGGCLVYITCSILPDENERVVRRFLEEHPEFDSERPEVAERLPEAAASPEGWLRLDPAVTGTDGFFVARLRRDGGQP